MKKNVSFMRTIYSPQEMEIIQSYLEPIFAEDNTLFKQMLSSKLAYLEGKRFTYILHPELKKKYRIMGNCIGPILYVRDVLNIDDPDTILLDDDSTNTAH